MKLFIDTDPGCDDIMALIYLLKHSKHEVIGMSSVAGNVGIEYTTRNLRLIAGYFNKECQRKIKVYKGASKPIIHVAGDDAAFFHGEDGFCNFFTSEYYETNKNDIDHLIDSVELSELPAVMGLIEMSKKYKGELTIVGLGPLTNVALAHIIDPGFNERIQEIMIMGGEIYGHGNSQFHPCSEYNFNKDPEAAYVVLTQMNCKITILPLEPNHDLTKDISDKWLANLKGKQNILGNIMFAIIQFLSSRRASFRLYDLILAVIIEHPSVVSEILNAKVTLELSGKYSRGKLIIGDGKSSNEKSKISIVKSLNHDLIFTNLDLFFQ